MQRFLHAKESREIIFVRGTTEAINLVASSYGGQNVGPGDEVVITWMEHHSNIVPWQMLCEAKEAATTGVADHRRGRTAVGGTGKIIDATHQNPGADARVQRAGHDQSGAGDHCPGPCARRAGTDRRCAGGAPLRIDVQELDCDFYCFSGHKMYGPTGIGVLYGKAALLEAMPPYQGGGDMISSVSFAKTYYNDLPYKFEAGTPNIADVIGLGTAVDYLNQLGLDAIAAHEQQLLEHATAASPKSRACASSAPLSTRPRCCRLSLPIPPCRPWTLAPNSIWKVSRCRTGHHCCQPLMERYGIAGTARASFGLYNTLQEVDIFAAALRRIVAEAAAKVKPAALAPTTRPEPAFPKAAGASPQAVAEELIELFEFLPDWTERYQHIIEVGEKIPPMPSEFKTEANRVKGCQSTVFLQTRKRPGTTDVVEFLADSDADIVRGLVALLERVFSGQKASQIGAFDVEEFFSRLGLNHHLSMGRHNGLAAMVQRIRNFAADLADKAKSA